jgi:hypothetical protein
MRGFRVSYDLEVYGKNALSTRELAKLVSADRALSAQVDKKADAVDAVVWKKTGAHFFTIDGPMEVEPEDLPEDWPEGEGATVLYSLSITYDVSDGPGAFSATVDSSDVDAAMAFATRLAERIDGAVMDPQSWEPEEGVEPEPEPEPAPEPSKARYLHMTWWRLRDDSKDLAEIYLRTARELFPGAVPTRFGTYEPMQGKLPRDGDSAFDAMHREEGRLAFRSASVKFGSIGDWTNHLWVRVQSVDLTFDLSRLEKVGAVSEIERFFVALAERIGAVFAFVSVTYSPYVSGSFRFLRYGEWSGLPQGPRWMTWFGSDYTELVRPHIDPALVTNFSDGLLHRWADHPVSAEELQEMNPDPWLPAELIGKPDPDDDYWCRDAAEEMPDALRRPAEGTPQRQRIEAHYARMRELMANSPKVIVR